MRADFKSMPRLDQMERSVGKHDSSNVLHQLAEALTHGTSLDNDALRDLSLFVVINRDVGSGLLLRHARWPLAAENILFWNLI